MSDLFAWGPLALGTFEFGSTLNTAATHALLDAFAERGGQLLDTAPTYGGAHAETLIGDWARRSGAPVRIVTKAGLDPARLDRAVLDADHLAASAERSAHRLGRPADVLVLHRDDPAVPVAEVAHTLHHITRTGTAVRVGASNWSTPRLRAWIAYARAHDLTIPVCTQPLWSLARRTRPVREPWLVEADDDHLHLAIEQNLAVLPYRVLAAGFLATHHSGRHDAHTHATYRTDANTARLHRLREVAADLCTTSTVAAISYLRAATAAAVIPIMGARTPAQVREAWQVANVHLSAAALAYLAG
ncbi:aldo/keto reductase [Nocardiopsis synnemataformans]|uniref:aldo/keto reductase n=1 Tax=Nocardiopsis synnemataformans TaxID=61305 RepID=UPI003EBA9B74